MKTVHGSLSNGKILQEDSKHDTYYVIDKHNYKACEKKEVKIPFIVKDGKLSYIPSNVKKVKDIVIEGTSYGKSLCQICNHRLKKLVNPRACGTYAYKCSTPGPGCFRDFDIVKSLKDILNKSERSTETPLQNKNNMFFLALSLNYPLNTLTYFATNKKYHYTESTITTNNGKKERKITAPSEPLKAIQRAILDKMLNHHPVLDCVKGFVKGQNVATNAAQHVQKDVVMSVDIKDFFSTISKKRVSGLFKKIGFDPKCANLLANLLTYNGILPQGTPTSPMIANMIAHRMDKVLTIISKKFEYTYTRYADDLTFSGNNKNPKSVTKFLNIIREIVTQQGFVLNEKKTKIMRKGKRQYVTGLCINKKTNIISSRYANLRAILHNCKNSTIEVQALKFYDKTQDEIDTKEKSKRLGRKFWNCIKGRIAYVKISNEVRYNKLKAMQKEVEQKHKI